MYVDKISHCNISSGTERANQLAKDVGEKGVQDSSYKLTHHDLLCPVKKRDTIPLTKRTMVSETTGEME